MFSRIKENAGRIAYSFGRAFLAVIALTQIGDLQNSRGWQGVLLAAFTAGITAALRTAEAIWGKDPDSTVTPPSV